MRVFSGVQEQLVEYFEVYAYPLLRFLRKNLHEPVGSVDNNLVQSIERILNCFISQYEDTELKTVTQEEIEELSAVLENLFLYAVVWAIGVTTDAEGRRRFDLQLRNLLQNRTLKVPVPAGSLYNLYFDHTAKKYMNWAESSIMNEIDPSQNFNEITVPTTDSIRVKHLYRMLLTNKYHILSPGPTGTGKSVNITSLLERGMPENYQYIAVTFSAQTSANQTQDLIDGKMQRRRNKVLGPPPGKYYVIFVDDLNMPKKEPYGAQPPLELLRQ